MKRVRESVKKLRATTILLAGMPIVLLFSGLLISRNFHSNVPPIEPTKPHSVYDEALDILKNFVRAGDYQLGFSDTNEFAGAYIDTSNPILLYRQVIDSLKAHGLDTTNVFEVHQTEYLIYAKSQLHSVVVFDSVFDSLKHVNHWSPVEFSAAVVPVPVPSH